MRDQLTAVKEQLGTVNTQLAQMRDERGVIEKKLQQAIAAGGSPGNSIGTGAVKTASPGLVPPAAVGWPTAAK